ncbi:calcium/sodium antiporter [Penaeicola halotolerans]|uniref:calcium/sodium antiporter n=1 Tax=Penaeicola halotolerans TaxID=2793196 RepID=UPI001CF8BFD5|nr:calcium/sodium antiporter [Penaeicola halotolerans]
MNPIILLIAGLVVLIIGGEGLVRGASSIALRVKISPMVVGLTIVAFGTSAPELLVSVNAALSGSPDISMGNVVGSNIANLGLVLGLTAVISPIMITPSTLKVDWPMTMGTSLLLFLLALNTKIGLIEGLIFISILTIYTTWTIRKSRKATKALEGETIEEMPVSKSIALDILWIALGVTGLYFGSDWFVSGAVTLAKTWGISERVIGVTVIAVGTSLPELVTSVIAAIKKETDIAVGNLLGSNIFNILSILGITSLISEINISPQFISYDMIWMLGITAILLPMMLLKRDINRIEGAILLIIYSVYTYLVVIA